MDKSTVLPMLQSDYIRLHTEFLEISKTVKNLECDTRSYIEALLTQVTSSNPGPLLAKTPKLPKRRGTRIKDIPENDEMEIDEALSNERSSRSYIDPVVLESSVVFNSRSKRGASIKAADNIKKQQTMTLNTKLRRASKDDVDTLTNKVGKASGKRLKDLESSEDEDLRCKKKLRSKIKVKEELEDSVNSVNSEANKTVSLGKQKRTTKRKLEEASEDTNSTITSVKSARQSSLSNGEPAVKKLNCSKDVQLNELEKKSLVTQKSPKSNERVTRSSSSLINAHCSKKYKINNIINETTEMSADETLASMYEDAIGKPIPIMNSTMNPNSTVTLEKMLNVTVLIEPIQSKKIFNETVTIKKNSIKEELASTNRTISKAPEENNAGTARNSTSKEKKTSKLQLNTNKQIIQDNTVEKIDDLITDDDSSPERKEYKARKEQWLSNQNKRVTRSNNGSLTSDEVEQTPIKLIQQNKNLKGSALKSTYKQNVLFSPYAKDSVKKRVEAFELVATSPKQNDNETPGRVTRTKTRALAAASFTEGPNLAQKLARKSLAKAKKISLAKHIKDSDDTKENENNTNLKPTKIMNSAQKPSAKTTPLGKNRMLQMPNSISKIQYATPSNAQSTNNYSKALTASRGNIVTHLDSFIQPMKSASKHQDRVAEERRRRAHDEDAKRKREELLKAQAEVKKRKREEKELKNKLAREAKDKLDYEKRLKAEKEREEKAKLAQQIQEKQREEMEKKRIAQILRAQEKEERRKQEELLRLQRMQEQEEQERQLAEQKRREQELEKRKQAEMRQMQAELKLKQQAALHNKAKVVVPKALPTSYKIDSDPDEDESDDENKPKHEIPAWASKNVRPTQLAIQHFIAMKRVLRFFDAKKCTPDLRELFQGIDPKRLKRSSSANWKTPPRYSMMNCSIIKD